MAMVRGCEFPEDRAYHVEYNVWVKPYVQGVYTLGATAFGAALAVEFFAFMPKPAGTRIEAGRAAGLLELSKSMVSVRTPVGGRITEVNLIAVTRPATITEDPYGAGWLVRIASDDSIEGLVTGAATAPAFEAAMALEDFEGPPVR
jgi:glycine cleavage system H protein